MAKATTSAAVSGLTIIELFPAVHQRMQLPRILNTHADDLLRYRGNACQAWAILKDEDRIGLCIHRMIRGEMDSVDIITRDYLPIDLATELTRVLNWMTECAQALLLESIGRLNADPLYVLERQSKNPSHAVCCYPRRPEDGCGEWGQSAAKMLSRQTSSGFLR
jgi:methionyl-tRNA formyltransferase